MTESPATYPNYKPSDVSWIGHVPTHWEVRRLKADVSDVVDLTNHRKRNESYVALEHVESWTGRIMESESDATFENQVKRFRPGDVLFGKLRPYLAKVTHAQRHGVCVGEFLVLRPHHATVDPSYLTRLIRSKPAIGAIDASTFGAKMPRADWQFIGSMLVPIPPLDEQSTIVRYLDRADELINRYISAKERLIALLEEQRQAVIQQAVTRGYEPDVPLKPSHVTNVPMMPAHWEIKRLKSMSHIRYGLGQPPRESPNGLPLIRATNVSRGHITENAMMYVDPYDVPTTRDAFLRENEIIVVRSGAYTADSAIIPKRYEGAISGYDMVVAATEANPEFLAMALLSTYVRDDQLIVVSNRAAQPHLNAEELGDAKILTPPRPEQETIVNYLHHRLTEVATSKEWAHRQIHLMHEYRTRLIADVVTGQIDVRSAAVVVQEP